MDPESLRRCMSFGFSDKQSDATIGQCMYLLAYSAYAYYLMTMLVLY